MDALETYLQELRLTHATGAGVKETSYYPALAHLLNTVGKSLKPRVNCVINVRNQGAGIPDGGLFTSDQLRAVGDAPFKQGPTPSRGVIEVKGTGDELDKVLKTEQIERYWHHYGQVLVTNLRDFALVGTDAAGDRAVLERYSLAPDEATFWAADPSSITDAHAEPFVQYLSRVMLHNAPLATPKDVAWFLASYARDAKARVDRADLPALAQIRTALEQALGLRFEGERGNHFFRSTLVQTLFYGVFSAWVLWSKKRPLTSKTPFNWHDAEYELRVPMIRALFEQLAMGSRLRPLGLIEVLDWTAAALNRVDRAAFFDAFEEDAAVQYFYEPFLEEFDPELRKQLGVWYTPPEIVRYMVERVDTVLREELDLPDGLADPSVYVLDPCTGTGSYLVETLRRIGRTLAEKGDDALAAYHLKRAAMERIVGFEILPAPFVVAHLQLGLLLQDLGAPFAEMGDAGDERAGVYLTNALTGWDPATGPKQRLLFPELEAERDAADNVKRTKPILVVLGNPPYNAFTGVSPEEEAGLVEPYKLNLNASIDRGGWGIKKYNLDDLYVRFLRLAERRIAEQTGRGVVCYISNFSYLADPSFVVMRQRFLAGFDKLWFDSLNGDSRETGKQTPDGKPDPSIFSTPSNREGIRVGTAIGLMVRKSKREPTPTVRIRQLWGVTKRTDLIESLNADDFDSQYEKTNPAATNRYSFRFSAVSAEYSAWPPIAALADVDPSLGILENRRGALVSIDREDLEKRMRMYYDKGVSWDSIEATGSGLSKDAARFDAKKARAKALEAESFSEQAVRRLMVRPMDNRWSYYTRVRPLWNEPRTSYVEQCWEGNAALVSRRQGVADPEGAPFFFTSAIGVTCPRCSVHAL